MKMHNNSVKKPMNVEIKQITLDADFSELAQQIAAAQWDDANEIEPQEYSAECIRNFVEHPRSVLIFAYLGNTFAGLTSGTVQAHPHGSGKWLYVDEVDTAVDQRRKGVGKAMMEWCFDYAKTNGLKEVALGTERDNVAARGLYDSLKPSYTEDVIWYGYEVGNE